MYAIHKLSVCDIKYSETAINNEFIANNASLYLYHGSCIFPTAYTANEPENQKLDIKIQL